MVGPQRRYAPFSFFFFYVANFRPNLMVSHFAEPPPLPVRLAAPVAAEQWRVGYGGDGDSSSCAGAGMVEGRGGGGTLSPSARTVHQSLQSARLHFLGFFFRSSKGPKNQPKRCHVFQITLKYTEKGHGLHVLQCKYHLPELLSDPAVMEGSICMWCGSGSGSGCTTDSELDRIHIRLQLLKREQIQILRRPDSRTSFEE